MTATTHDPRLREALVVLKQYEADRLVWLAERERDRQKIYALEKHIASMKMSASRARKRRAQEGT